MPKFKNDHDARVYNMADEVPPVGVIGRYWATDLLVGPLADEYGTQWLIVYETGRGDVVVMTFDTQEKRDAHLARLDVAATLALVGYSDPEFIAMLSGYRFALADAFDFVDQDWSEKGQEATRQAVIRFLIEHAEDARAYMAVTGQSPGEVGMLWANACLGTGETFTLYAAGEAVDSIMGDVGPKPAVFDTPDGLDLA
jgi:hypothetical protein